MVKADWPDLTNLSLSHEGLNTSAMTHISKGKVKWPKLRLLHLHGNAIYGPGIMSLTDCAWPHLDCFILDMRSACAQNSAVLGSRVTTSVHASDNQPWYVPVHYTNLTNGVNLVLRLGNGVVQMLRFEYSVRLAQTYLVNTCNDYSVS